RDLEPIRVLGREAVHAEVFPRLLDEGAAERPEARGDRVHVLSRLAPDAEPHALGAVAALAEVILRETDVTGPGLEHDAQEPAALLPTLGHEEPQPLVVPVHTALEVVDGEARCDRAEPERFGPPALGPGRAGAAGLRVGCGGHGVPAWMTGPFGPQSQ